MEENKRNWKEILIDTVARLVVSGFALFLLIIPSGILSLVFFDMRYLYPLRISSILALPVLALGLIWIRKRKKFLKYWGIGMGVLILGFIINTAYIEHDNRITIDTTPNINLHAYLPFDPDSKIATLDQPASLKLRADPRRSAAIT